MKTGGIGTAFRLCWARLEAVQARSAGVRVVAAVPPREAL
jgi:hypothetical protein